MIAGASVYAAMYVALILVFNSISYGQIQLRVANVIVGLVPIMGWPAIVGQTVGVMIANSFSPLGPIDLINVIPSFLFSFIIWKLRKVSVFLGLSLYSLALGITVSLALNYAFGEPLIVGIPTVTIGIFIATAVFGYIFYRAVKGIDALGRIFGEQI
ncbi:MAG: QueT transporter family protein [Thaumarchaeota archaeon]|nr:QueT transporter family protein [Nitrososphaerota archaeon]